MQYSIQYQNATINDQVLSLIEKVKRGEYKANDYVSFGVVPDAIAKIILDTTGIDVQGFDLRIEARQIENILRDHGENGKADRSMKNDVDIAKMGYVLAFPDSIVPAGRTKAYSYLRDGYNRTAETVLYEKNIGNNRAYYVIQALPITKKKAVYVVSAFIGKEGYKKETPQLTDVQDPSATSEIASAEVSDIIIPDSSKKSNTQYSLPSDAAYMDAVNRGDMDTAQRMVDEAARAAMPDAVLRDADGKLIKMYHGSPNTFNEFRNNNGRGHYFSPWE